MLYKLWFFRINFLMSVLLKELQNCIICIIREWSSKSVFQKQPSRGVLKKRCSENMQFSEHLSQEHLWAAACDYFSALDFPRLILDQKNFCLYVTLQIRIFYVTLRYQSFTLRQLQNQDY